MSNDDLLKEVKSKALNISEKATIGILQEHTLHRIFKYYLCSDDTFHEIKVGNLFADIKIDNCIYEVQTKSFNNLKDKLNVFLKDYSVTIVYPIIVNKMIYLFDEQGVLLKQSKSNKHMKPLDIFVELYKIKGFLLNPNLHFRLILIDADEHRITKEVTWKSRKGYERTNQIPSRIIDDLSFNCLNDFLSLVDFTKLSSSFTVKEFKKAFNLSQKTAYYFLHIMSYYGLIIQDGKFGKANLYKKEISI